MEKAPAGFSWVPFGGTGDDVGTVVIAGTTKIGDKRVPLPEIVVPDVVIPFPTTKKAMAEYASGRTFTILDVDGNEINFNDVEALAASKIKHDYETVRGAYRNESAKILARGGDPVKAINVDAIRGQFRTIYRPGSGVATQVIPEEELKELTRDEMIEMLKNRGIVS